MATTEPVVKVEDVAGVRSRVSWQAVVAGSVVAVVTNLVLTLFFAAIGLSLTQTGMPADTLGWGALVAVLLSILAALFVGGWVTTQLTAGETHQEAVLYGILTWAAVVFFSLMLVGMGMRAGYFALVGGAMVAQNSPGIQNAQNWEQAARNLGVSQERIDAIKASSDPDKARAIANDPKAQEQMREASIYTAWTALVGILLSMATAIGGAMAGCGPSFKLFAVAARAPARRELIVP